MQNVLFPVLYWKYFNTRAINLGGAKPLPANRASDGGALSRSESIGKAQQRELRTTELPTGFGPG